MLHSQVRAFNIYTKRIIFPSVEKQFCTYRVGLFQTAGILEQHLMQ